MTLLCVDVNAEELIRHTLQHDGIEREYFVHKPADVSADKALPVMVAIHGYTSTATGFARHHGLNRHADDNGYLVVYPQGSHFTVGETNYRVTSWNDLAANLESRNAGPHCVDESVEYPCPPECGSCDKCDWTSCNDDVGFIDKLLDAVADQYSTDPDRYYLLGVSNGGMMTLRLGCNLSARFAAIAPIIGQLAPGYDCGPTSDIPMLHLAGALDDTVRVDGKPGGDGFIYTTVPQTMATWARALGCEDEPQVWQNQFSIAAGVQCTGYTACRTSGHEVVSCIDNDGGHAWPAQRVADVPATCVTPIQQRSMPGQAACPADDGEYRGDGMDLVWNFFRRYPSTE